MTEQKEKKQNNQATGYFLIVLGIIGIATKFFGETTWSTVSVIKMTVSILVLAYGLWSVLKKKAK
jgi:uncharacterized membrane protein